MNRNTRKFLRPGCYEDLLAQQNGVCAICGRAPTNHKLSLDHDHETGQFRGLLCAPCNSALGKVERYLEEMHAFLDPTKIERVDQFIRNYPKGYSDGSFNRNKTYCVNGHNNWGLDSQGFRKCKTCAAAAHHEWAIKNRVYLAEYAKRRRDNGNNAYS